MLGGTINLPDSRNAILAIAKDLRMYELLAKDTRCLVTYSRGCRTFWHLVTTRRSVGEGCSEPLARSAEYNDRGCLDSATI